LSKPPRQLDSRCMAANTAFLEREYNARAAIREHPQIFARWAEQGAAARRLRACDVDLQYGPLNMERLDIFHAHQSDAPLLVFIHGGYWRSLDKSDFSWIAPPLLQHGVAVAVTNYGLAPQTSIEDIVRQQLKALAWLYHNAERLRFNPDRIVVAGHSAGGHLTAMMMAALWQQFDSTLPSGLVKAGLAISGLFDLRPLVSTPFVNVDLKLDLKRARALSPIEMQSATSAALITAVGALESSEFKRQSTEFGAKWSTNLTRHLELPLANHLTVCDELANPGSPLFDAMLELIRRV
jgi:arylformamidase